jgi:two-component system sensor histidine kinase BaeS
VRSLWFKLTAALVLVTLLGVGLSVIVPTVVTVRSFESFVRNSRVAEQEEVVEALAIYYEVRGTWEGLDALVLPRSERVGHGMGPMMVPGMPGMWTYRVADERGVVFLAPRAESVGEQLSEAQLRDSMPIEVEGREVGFLVPATPVNFFREPEEAFLQRFRETIVPVGAAACAVAILLGLFLTWQLTDPVRRLTVAARGIAGGDLSQHVDIKSRDEIGELGRAFNEMAENLSRAEELRRNMTADIAHELRTPLSVMRANLEAILDGVFEPTRENVSSIHKEAVLLSRLVDDLQELALAEAGQLRIEPESTDILALVERVARGVAARTESEGVTLVQDLPPDLPTVSVDSQRIGQALSNLVDNALRHSSEGGKVTVRARQAGQVVQVDVVDEGPGLSPEELSMVFERFYRGDKARSRKTGGAGLGLSIVKQLVEAHGGRVWAESAEGQGATFSFTLPVQGPEDA